MRRLLRIAFAFTVLVLALVVGGLVALRTRPVREYVERVVIGALAEETDADVRIGAVEGSLVHTLVLRDVRLIVARRAVVRVPRIELAYGLVPLLRGELRLQRVVVSGPRVRAVRTARGWRLPHLTGRGGRSGPPALAVVVERLAVERGRVAVALHDAEPPRRFAATAIALDASAGIGRRRTIDVRSLAFVPRGIDLSPVRASAAIAEEANGAVRVTNLDVVTARTRVSGRGAVAPGRRLDLRVALAPLAAADVRALVPASRLETDVRARARARGPWRGIAGIARADLGPGGTIVARTTVDAGAKPLAHTSRVDVVRVDPGAVLARLPRASVSGSVRVAGAGFAPGGPVSYRVALHDSVIADRRLDRLTVTGRADGGTHRLRGEVAAPVGEAAFHARIALGTPLGWRMAARWTVARVDLLAPSTWGWATGRARAVGRGIGRDERRGTVAVTLARASVHGLPLDGGALHLRIAGDAVRVSRLSVAGTALGLALDASGRADLARRAATLAADARVDLGAVGAYLGASLAGAVSVSARADGPLDALDAGVTLDVTGAAYASVSAATAGARVDLHGLGGAGPRGTVAFTATGFRIRTGREYAGRADVDWRRQAGEDRVDLRVAATDPEGRPQRVALDAARTPARTRATVREVVLAPPVGPPWRLERPADVTLDATLATPGLALVAGAQRVALTGRVAARGGTSDATLSVERIDLTTACALAELPACGGTLAARIALAGPPAAPALTVDATVDALAVQGIGYGTARLGVRYADRAARVDAALTHPQAGTLTVAGRVPVDLAWAGPRVDLADAPIALTAHADALDLTIIQALAPRTVTSSAGRLRLDVRVGGSRADPRIDGDVSLDGGRVQLVAAGVPYEDIRARLVADGGRVVVRELHAKAGDGTADVTGTVALARTASAVDLGLRLDKFFAVRQESYEAAVSGAVAIRGTVSAPDVTGTIDVDRALIRPAALPTSGRAVERDPTIEVVGGPGQQGPEKPAGAGMPAELSVAVKVVIERNAWIRRQDANIEIAGRLEVTKPRGEPLRVTGQIRLVRGWYAFQGKRFELDHGTITFTGASPPKPLFDVTAVYRTTDYRITVHITGSADKPTLDLSSEPSLEQADVLSVLLFGKPARQLGRQQSQGLQEQALGLAASYAMPELRTSVMNTLGLDTLQVEMPEGTEPGKVSAGRYVAEDVFVSLGQEFGRRAGQVVGVEYSLGRNVSIRASTSTRGDSAIDLFWRHRY